jgi:hypothetical protein
MIGKPVASAKKAGWEPNQLAASAIFSSLGAANPAVSFRRLSPYTAFHRIGSFHFQNSASDVQIALWESNLDPGLAQFPFDCKI